MGTEPGQLSSALESLRLRITSSSRDFGEYHLDAWLYGIAVGWDCEEDHEHDDICGGTAAMDELAARHGWGDSEVARLRGYREAWASASGEKPS